MVIKFGVGYNFFLNHIYMNSISSEKQPKVVIIQTDEVNIVKKGVHTCFGYIIYSEGNNVVQIEAF